MSFIKTWLPIFRLGLVQACLGGMFVLCTSLLNRVMTVEIALAASVPGVLLGVHHVVQLSRPRWGYGADRSQSRTPWIVG
ncbi:MAG: PucC family protein, partial [Myxococcota bacterium]